MDVTMGALLLAAFFSINILSLVYLAIIAVGMAMHAQPRRLVWRFCVLPLLAVLLITQYSLLIGPPPPFDEHDLSHSSWKKRHHSSDADDASVKASFKDLI